MRVLRLAAMIFAIVGGYLALPRSGLRRPARRRRPALRPNRGSSRGESPVGYRRGYGYGRGYGYRRGWVGWGYRRPIYGYGYRRPVYGWGGPGLVCRWRPSPWGPRRVCW